MSCIYCGAPTPRGGTKYCTDYCRKQYEKKRRQGKNPAMRKANAEIAMDAKSAMAAGMTYGQWQAQKYLQK